MHVGFIGLGIMGSRMAACLLRAGHSVTAWNRTPEKAGAWLAEAPGPGAARIAAEPAEAAAAEAVITMVVDGAQVEELLLGGGGAARAAGPGTLFIDMSTIAPADARRLAAALHGLGLRFLDAPVSGSSPKAADGTLTIMAGGEAADFATALPLFEAMGEVVVHVGPHGHGQVVKVLNNALAAANAGAVAEALLAASAAGVDLDAFERVVGAGSGGSAMLALKARPMRRHDWSTLFKLEHMLKDVDLAIGLAAEHGLQLDFADRARLLLDRGVELGLGGADFAAMLESVEDREEKRLRESL